MSPEFFLGRARRALGSARLLLYAGDLEGTCNRAYYCMFEAARAALVATEPGLNPASVKTHRGLIAAFSKHLVKSGLLSAELGRSLNQVERIRLLADYTGEAIDEHKAGWTIDQASRFLGAFREPLGPCHQ